MTRTYNIHLTPYTISIFSTPNYKKIPNHALTQYAYSIYPTHPAVRKVVDGFCKNPTPQRKMSRDARPLTTIQTPIAPIASKQLQKTKRSKFRKNINKDALAEYFDNKPTREQAIQQWRDMVVAELDATDKIKYENTYNAQQDIEQRYEIFSGFKDFNYATATPQEIAEINSAHTELFTMSATEFNSMLTQIIFFENLLNILTTEISHPAPITTPQTRPQKSKSHRTMSPNRNNTIVNEFIADRFVRKYDGADTVAAMRAYNKKKHHGTKIAYLLHQLQITK